MTDNNEPPFKWSRSSLKTFETCPYQYYRTRVLKDVDDPPGDAAMWGSEVHEAIEYRVRDGTPLPGNMTQYEGKAAAVVRSAGSEGTELYVEHKMAVDLNWQPVSFDSPEAYGRGLGDILLVKGKAALLRDWKTGKVRDDRDQAMLYAVMTFIHFPQVNVITTEWDYMVHKEITRGIYHRSNLELYIGEINGRVSRVARSHATNEWPCKQSGLCNGWCPVKDCSHWRPKRSKK